MSRLIEVSRVVEWFRRREHESKLRREAPLAVIAVEVAVESGQPPLKAFEGLAQVDSLPTASGEARRILNESILSMRHLFEQLEAEAREARGVWGKLLATIVGVEATGMDARVMLRDLVNTVLRDLKTDYERLTRRFQSLISSATVVFGAFPMMIAVMLGILASTDVVPMLLASTAVNLFLAALWILTVDLQVPEIADYEPFYKRILGKWLPLGVAVAAASYAGLLYLPVSLVYRSPLALALGALAFSLPAYLEWRLQARVQDELLENLPLVLRGVAEQVARGLAPHQALENVARLGGFPKYTTRLLSLIVKEARVHGSLRDAYEKIKGLLPKPWRVSLELLTQAEEMGAGSGAIHALADSVSEYVIAIREFRRATSTYKWLSLGMTALTFALLAFISRTVMVKMAVIGALLEQSQGLVTLPFKPPTPDQLPAIKDSIYLAAAANSLALAVVAGKTVGWRLGDSIPELLKTSLLLIALLLAVWWL